MHFDDAAASVSQSRAVREHVQNQVNDVLGQYHYLNPTERAIRLRLGRDAGRPVDFLEIDGHVAQEQAAELERAIQSHLPDEPLLVANVHGEYQEDGVSKYSSTLALTQLLLTYHVLRMYRGVVDLPFAPAVAALNRLNISREPEPAAERRVTVSATAE